MHILLTNDDGPPNPSSSPYISTFIRVLTSPPFNHKVSVVVPTQQRSWIGKAHLLPPSSFPTLSQNGQIKNANEDIDDCVTPTYYDPATGESHPNRPDEGEYWACIPGTPATCVQLALFHHSLLFPPRQNGTTNGNGNAAHSISNSDSHTSQSDARKCPFDVIVSGPNYGRNTTAAFALSSGTIGGALEGAICGVKAIAISFAFFTRKETDAMVEAASALSGKLIERLYRDWDTSSTATTNGESGGAYNSQVPDLYSINVPLVEGIAKAPVYWTWMLPNQVNTGSLYKLVNRKDVSEGEKNSVAPSFKWSPNFADVWATVEDSPEGNDGKVIREKCVSVTPLKANFQSLFGVGSFVGEVKL